MKDARIGESCSFIDMLDEEARAGGACARTLLDLPSSTWEDAVASHPEWVRAGTMRALLSHANEHIGRDSSRAAAITSFVIDHVHDVPVPPFGRVLVDPLEGEAYAAHGDALLAAGDVAAALNAVVLAEGLLSLVAIAATERADATFVHARICGALRRDDEALDLFDDCLRVYAQHASSEKYVRALSARALLLSSRSSEARHEKRSTTPRRL